MPINVTYDTPQGVGELATRAGQIRGQVTGEQLRQGRQGLRNQAESTRSRERIANAELELRGRQNEIQNAMAAAGLQLDQRKQFANERAMAIQEAQFDVTSAINQQKVDLMGEAEDRLKEKLLYDQLVNEDKNYWNAVGADMTRWQEIQRNQRAADQTNAYREGNLLDHDASLRRAEASEYAAAVKGSRNADRDQLTINRAAYKENNAFRTNIGNQIADLEVQIENMYDLPPGQKFDIKNMGTYAVKDGVSAEQAAAAAGTHALLQRAKQITAQDQYQMLALPDGFDAATMTRQGKTGMNPMQQAMWELQGARKNNPQMQYKSTEEFVQTAEPEQVLSEADKQLARAREAFPNSYSFGEDGGKDTQRVLKDLGSKLDKPTEQNKLAWINTAFEYLDNTHPYSTASDMHKTYYVRRRLNEVGMDMDLTGVKGKDRNLAPGAELRPSGGSGERVGMAPAEDQTPHTVAGKWYDEQTNTWNDEGTPLHEVRRKK